MDYALIICTPHSVKAGIVDEILGEIRRAVDFKTVLQKRALLSVEDIKTMYPRLVIKPVFTQIVECLLAGEVECVLVAAADVHAKINGVKGKFLHENGRAKSTGLRRRFQKDEESFEFVFHSTDSNNESYEMCVRLFSPECAELVHLRHSLGQR